LREVAEGGEVERKEKLKTKWAQLTKPVDSWAQSLRETRWSTAWRGSSPRGISGVVSVNSKETA